MKRKMIWIDRLGRLGRFTPYSHFVGLVVLVHLLPVWIFPFFPTQDGLSHVYNGYILKEYHNPAHTKFREVYDLNFKLFPNWLSHLFFMLALYVFPPLVAEKIFVSLCIALLPLAFFFCFQAIDKRRLFYGFFGFLFSYNYLLHMGFYNFAISVPLFFFTLGYWWKHQEQMNAAKVAIFYLMLLLTYFAHLFSFALLLLTLSFLAGMNAILLILPSESNGKSGTEAAPFAKTKRSWKDRTLALLVFVGMLLPAYFILLNALLSNPETQEKSYRTFQELKSYFFSVGSLVYYGDEYKLVSWLLLGLVAGLCLWTIWKDKIQARRLLSRQDAFLLLFFGLTWLFFRIPWQVGPPAWLNDRLNLYLIPILIPWLTVSFPKWCKQALVGVMLLLSFIHLGLSCHDYALLNSDLKEFTSGAALIKPNSVVSIQSNDWHGSEAHGSIKYLSPYYHDTVYYCLGNGSLYTGNYEPKYSYFPLRYKKGYWKFEYPGTIDYMLTWRMEVQSEAFQQLLQNYKVIHSTPQLKLMRNKAHGNSKRPAVKSDTRKLLH